MAFKKPKILKDLLILEPFYGGSHKQLIDTLLNALPKSNISYDLITLPSKKWHWKARTSAAQFLFMIDHSIHYKTVFCSSVLNLCELIGLLPALSNSHKVIYFHENQLEYPVQKVQERDFQYGYNQILSAFTADCILFNSRFNMDSFLSKVDRFFKKIPDSKSANVEEKIRPKCSVLYFPLITSDLQTVNPNPRADALHIVWPHRWEHDKDPETFFDVLFELKSNGLDFYVSVFGEQFSEIPEIFHRARTILGDEHIRHWGYAQEKSSYYNVLASSDIVISTAQHEFFGVSMIEAAYLGCLPLCPNRLVYPEVFPKSCLYNTRQQLFKKLKQYCKNRSLVKVHYDECDFNWSRFDWDNLKPQYFSHLWPTL